MTKEQIMQVLLAVSHGRVNHPLVEQLAEKLEAVNAASELTQGRGQQASVDVNPYLAAFPQQGMQLMPVVSIQPQFAPAGTPDPVQASKRGSGRKKAE